MTARGAGACLVTGASRGLGRHIAAAFWEAGAHLFLTARSERDLAATAAALPKRRGQRVETLAADLADPAAPERIVAAARRAFPHLDTLVNNAAIQGPIGPAWENDAEAWREAVAVDLLAPAALCRLAVPWLAERGRGAIVNLSGGGATGARPRFSAYAAAKAALVRFTETLAEEARGLGVRANSVAPGAMDTAMTDAVLAAGPETAGAKEHEAACRVRSARGPACERAAALCVFLASPAAAGITGKLLSAVWDPWELLPEHAGELRDTDIYTLRRVVPRDRGCGWGERA